MVYSMPHSHLCLPVNITAMQEEVRHFLVPESPDFRTLLTLVLLSYMEISETTVFPVRPSLEMHLTLLLKLYVGFFTLI